MYCDPGKIGTPRSRGSSLPAGGAVVAVGFGGCGDSVDGREGCWPGRGNGAGFCAVVTAGNVSRMALRKKRETPLPSMNSIKPQKWPALQYFSFRTVHGG